MSARSYADYNATAPLRPEARAAIADALALIGNPSSAHRDGARVRRAIETARGDVAALLGRPAREVVFTSGATEANVLALSGVLGSGDRLVTSAIEHASILETARALEPSGIRVTRVPVTARGEVDEGALDAALAPRPALASFGLANGEVGTVLETRVLARLVDAATHVHLDASQAVGRMKLPSIPSALVSVSSHKLGGPTGVGALFVPPHVQIRPAMLGGGQERGRRGGTENVLGIVGFGAVARTLRERLDVEIARVRSLRDALWRRLTEAIPDLQRNGPPLERSLPNTLNVTITGMSGDAVLVRLDLAGISASLGSACAAGSPEASHVLAAMGRSDAAARSGLRLSLGWASTTTDVDAIVRGVVDVARAARSGVAA